jgi:hypothetical protein
VIDLTLWDREEDDAAVVPAIDFSPLPPIDVVEAALCWQTNVITLNNADVLGSENLRSNINTASPANAPAGLLPVRTPQPASRSVSGASVDSTSGFVVATPGGGIMPLSQMQVTVLGLAILIPTALVAMVLIRRRSPVATQLHAP